MAGKKGLGRGFDSLIPDNLFDESFDPTTKDDNSVSSLRVLKITDIVADPEQPRKEFDNDALKELAASIDLHGVLQPIVVTPHKKNGYSIVAGERRYRASIIAGKDTIPSLIRTVHGQQKLEVALIENLQRRDLNALETAVAYAKLRDQFNMTLEEIGRSVGGRSMSAISNTLRLLKLPRNVQDALVAGKVTEGQVRPLVDADTALIDELLPKIIAEGWSARFVEQTIRTRKPHARKPNAQPHPDYSQMTNQLVDRLGGAKVSISATAKGTGKIAISFKDEEELNLILKRLA